MSNVALRLAGSGEEINTRIARNFKMKCKLSWLGLGTLALGATLAFGQTAVTPPMGQGGNMGAQQARGKLQWLAQQLNLTEDQKEKLRPIIMKEGMELKELRDNTSMSQE